MKEFIINWVESQEAFSLGYILFIVLSFAAGYNTVRLENMYNRFPVIEEQVEVHTEKIDRLLEIVRFQQCKKTNPGKFRYERLDCSEFMEEMGNYYDENN